IQWQLPVPKPRLFWYFCPSNCRVPRNILTEFPASTTPRWQVPNISWSPVMYQIHKYLWRNTSEGPTGIVASSGNCP
ncbi:mCG123560, partial [Mus musculus]